MNREIKYRAWDIGKMIYNVYPTGQNGYGTWEASRWDGEEVTQRDFIEHGTNKAVLMQYTGLKDKNGKEIYEGDILKLPKGDYAVKVVWDYSKWEFWTGDGRLAESFSGFHEEYEIIGNIYENPNLIK